MHMYIQDTHMNARVPTWCVGTGLTGAGATFQHGVSELFTVTRIGIGSTQWRLVCTN